MAELANLIWEFNQDSHMLHTLEKLQHELKGTKFGMDNPAAKRNYKKVKKLDKRVKEGTADVGRQVQDS